MSLEGGSGFEIRETQRQAADFFAKHIRPNLPPGVRPERTYLELHSLVPRGQAEAASARV